MASARATVVLVHGAFHGAWCWCDVQTALTRRGVAALAVDLPGHGASPEPLAGLPGHGASPEPLAGLPEDARALREALGSCAGPVVVCGHSYGGAVVTEAAGRAVRHLVYLAALVPDAGESARDAAPELATGPIAASLLPRADGSVAVAPERAAQVFYQDCDPERASWAVSRLGPQRPESFETPTSRAAWREIESTYVVCDRDATLPPDTQRRLAKRCTRELVWPTGHSPMLSRPDLVADLLADLAS